MPGPLIAFFLLIGLTSADTLLLHKDAVWRGPDPRAGTKLGKPERGFITSISVPSIVLATRDVYGRERCPATVFAISRGQVVVTVSVDGQELAPDWSWAVDVEAEPGQRRTVAVRYAGVACHEVGYICATEVWDGRVREEVGTRCE